MSSSRTGFGGRLALGARPLVLVVDAIVGFTDPDRPLGSDATAVVEHTHRLLVRARERGIPVIFTAIAYQANMADAGLWPRKIPALADLIAGGPAVEVDRRLERRADEVVLVKKGASALHGTHLTALLVKYGCDSVVLCGLTTSGCVRATAVDLLQEGYPAVVPVECVGDRDEAAHAATLRDLDLKYADVVSLEDVLASQSFAETES